MFFINRQSGRYHETVDEFSDKEEAYRMVSEYQFSEHGKAYYYVSTCARSGWKK